MAYMYTFWNVSYVLSLYCKSKYAWDYDFQNFFDSDVKTGQANIMSLATYILDAI